jgi:hypothetical protein
MGDVTYAQGQCALIPRRTLATPRRARELRQPTRAHGADLERLLNPRHQPSPSCRLKTFFRMTSDRMCLRQRVKIT